MMKKNYKTNCFAFREGECIATVNRNCPDDCLFYKTNKKFETDFLRAKELLIKNGGFELAKETYPMFENMCSKIGGSDFEC